MWDRAVKYRGGRRPPERCPHPSDARLTRFLLRPLGDAFTAGMLAAMLWSEPLDLHQAVHLGLASARQRIDGARAGEELSVRESLTALQEAMQGAAQGTAQGAAQGTAQGTA